MPYEKGLRAAVVLLSLLIMSVPLAHAQLYDEQVGTYLNGTYSSMSYIVTAVPQISAGVNFGPGYMLNGLTDRGYGYKLGVVYNWPDSHDNPQKGFMVAYQIFDPLGNSVYPSSGGIGVMNLTVNPYDRVLLSLYFSYGTVHMAAYDLTTNQSASVNYTSLGAVAFVSRKDLNESLIADRSFTGIMTEWYRTDAYYGEEKQAFYTIYGTGSSSVWPFIDQFFCSSICSGLESQTLFFQTTQTPVNVGKGYYYKAEGTSIYFLEDGTVVTGNISDMANNAIVVTNAQLAATGLPQTQLSAAPLFSGYWPPLLLVFVFIIILIFVFRRLMRPGKNEGKPKGDSPYELEDQKPPEY